MFENKIMVAKLLLSFNLMPINAIPVNNNLREYLISDNQHGALSNVINQEDASHQS